MGVGISLLFEVYRPKGSSCRCRYLSLQSQNGSADENQMGFGMKELVLADGPLCGRESESNFYLGCLEELKLNFVAVADRRESWSVVAKDSSLQPMAEVTRISVIKASENYVI